MCDFELLVRAEKEGRAVGLEVVGIAVVVFSTLGNSREMFVVVGINVDELVVGF